MILSTVWAALLVCKEERMRWPVSAAVTAVEMVSMSLISPIIATFTSWRNIDLKAVLKSAVSVLTSLWSIIDLSWLNKYSMGSSIVVTCFALAWFMVSIIAAKVVDLPCPIGPTTRKKPCSFWAKSFRMSGKLSSLTVLALLGISLKAAPQ